MLLPMSVTLKEIAEASRVSISTASRAPSGHRGINAKTAKRVRDAADQLNYRTRQANVSQGSLEGTDVGILCLGMGNSLTVLPTVSATIAGAESALATAGARVVFASIPALASPPDRLLSRLPDTLILSSAMQGDVMGEMKSDFVDELKFRPTVWLLGRPADVWGDMVGRNDYEVGAMAARALLDTGHRRLAFVNPEPDHILFQRREDGFRALLP